MCKEAVVGGAVKLWRLAWLWSSILPTMLIMRAQQAYWSYGQQDDLDQYTENQR